MFLLALKHAMLDTLRAAFALACLLALYLGPSAAEAALDAYLAARDNTLPPTCESAGGLIGSNTPWAWR